MRIFTAFALSLAVVLGAALSSPTVAFSCGGGQTTGCKVATSPIPLDGLAMAIRWLEIVIP